MRSLSEEGGRSGQCYFVCGECVERHIEALVILVAGCENNMAIEVYLDDVDQISFGECVKLEIDIPREDTGERAPAQVRIGEVMKTAFNGHVAAFEAVFGKKCGNLAIAVASQSQGDNLSDLGIGKRDRLSVRHKL